MIIVRDGRAYELTQEEVYQAYREQELLYDIDDVRSELECIAEDDCDRRAIAAKAILDDETLLTSVACQKRRNEDRYGMNWTEAVHDAIVDALNDEIGSGCDGQDC